MNALVELRGVGARHEDTEIRDISLELRPATFHVFIGDAGAPLLLRLASLLEAPLAGEILVEGESLCGWPETARANLRSRRFGFVFAAPYLLPELTLAENVGMPALKVMGWEAEAAAARTQQVLNFVGLSSAGDSVAHFDRFDQQRVALARALVHQPAAVVLEQADAHLTPDEAARFCDLARSVCAQSGVAVLARFASNPAPRLHDRIVAIENGSIARDTGVMPEVGP